jgi:cytochrome o ubiquinol oxidase subunit 3
MQHASDHHDPTSIRVFGFWVFLMSDCIFFAALFATYAVLRNNTFGGPSAADILSPISGLFQSLLLLSSSAACAPLLRAASRRETTATLLWLGAVATLGALFFLSLSKDYGALLNAGHSWTVSGFLSALFNLIFSFGFHVVIALFWSAVLFVQTLIRSVNESLIRRLTYLKMFWHFLNIIWVFIFTIVYLIGGIAHAP